MPTLARPRARSIVLALALTVVVAASPVGPVGLVDALILGVVEGVTEYLPVSSTGHLAVVSRLLAPHAGEATQAALNSYVIVIQAGAILAVLGLYAGRARQVVAGALGRDETGRRLLATLVVGFVPAAVVGLLLRDIIQARLFGLVPIAAAWIVGGIVILWWERMVNTRDEVEIEEMTPRHGLIVGLAQILALWPGTSRSLVTILGGEAAGLTTAAAVEFSFLLGVVTLGAATVYEAAGSGTEIIDQLGVVPAVAGFIAATVAAAIAVRWLVSYLTNHSLSVFGWYRIALGVFTLLVLV